MDLKELTKNLKDIDIFFKNKNLYDFQITIIKDLLNTINRNKHVISANLLPGAGKTVVISYLIDFLCTNKIINKVLVISENKILSDQKHYLLSKVNPNIRITQNIHQYNEGVLFLTDAALLKADINLNNFELIICDDFSQTKIKKIEKFKYLCNSKNYTISFNIGNPEYYFINLSNIYKLELNETIQRIQYSQIDFITELVIPLLQKKGRKLKTEVPFENNGRYIRADLVSYDDHGNIDLACEIKKFRSKNISKVIESNIINQLLAYKAIIKSKKYLLIALCNISKETKEFLLEHGIVTWDISNLLYLCKKDLKLTKVLYSIADYSTLDIHPQKPQENITKNKKSFNNDFAYTKDNCEEYICRLKACKCGNKYQNDKKYEKICSDIVKYLFENEFKKFDEQHSTKDNIFRMDLLVSIKGSTDFWKFLINHYNTRFIVFEFKNYEDKISQNLIYITEKYLYDIALRNVAIIISRNGFSENANHAAMGCLIEHGKLIINLTDEDLIAMITAKKEGDDPSEYLYDKVESFLMSISK